VTDLPAWLHVLCVLVPYALFFAYCLWAINWQKMWPTLREGAWLPLVLLLILVALVWSQIRPTDILLFGVISVGNFWWQLSAAGLLAALGLFAGWLQDRYHWYPKEVPTEPAAHAHHDHGHDHH
jgi:hypothetical protein